MTRRLIAATILALALAGCDLTTRTEDCTAEGGQVVLDDTTYKVRDGKRSVIREYECTRDGVELFEWKVETRA
jgi:hypothetical protein